MNQLNRRNFLKASVATTAGVLTGCGKQIKMPTNSGINKKRNLLFVFTDQQSRDMLGCYGNKQVKTPNIDKFAKDAIRFEHCVSSQPVCTPCRGMLLTGRHPLYNGCFSNDIQLLDTGGNSFAEVLKREGYATGYFGKWHLYGGDRDRPIPKGPRQHGFDVFKSNNCHLNYQARESFYFDDDGKKVYFGKWEPYAQTQQACEFIEKNSDKSFAAFVSWHPPHNVGAEDYPSTYVNGATKELLDLYAPAKIELRPNVKDTPDVRKAYHGHMAMITGVDKAFGELVKKLKQLDLYENTLVVFTADHGDMLRSNKRYGPKSCPEVESVGVPFILKMPGSVRKNTSTEALLGSMDIMPTTLSLLGVEPPSTVQGINLASDIIEGRDDGAESLPLMYFAPAWRGVYTKRYTYARGEVYIPQKYVSKGFDGAANVLYDRQIDPYELNNRIDDPEYVEVKKRLEQLNQQWLDKFHDKFWDGKYILRKLMNKETIGFWGKGDTGVMTVPDTMPIDILK